MIDGGFLPAIAEQGDGEIVARLVIVGVGLDAGLEPVDLAAVPGRLLGEVEGGSGAGDVGVIGLGVALLPCFICGQDLRAGRLIQVLPAWSGPADTAIAAVYPTSRNLSPKVRVFVDFLTERFSGTPYWDRDLVP